MDVIAIVLALLAILIFAASFWVGGVFAAILAFVIAGVAVWRWRRSQATGG